MKPGDSYPFTLRIKNFGATPLVDAVVTLTAPDSTTVTDPDGPGGAVTIAGDTLTWNAGTVPGISGTDPGAASLVVDATADSLAQDPQIAWKDLSTDASLTYTGAGAGHREQPRSKVVPPEGGFDSARYGNRPFPVVPVELRRPVHDATASATALVPKINDPDEPGSTFNPTRRCPTASSSPRNRAHRRASRPRTGTRARGSTVTNARTTSRP